MNQKQLSELAVWHRDIFSAECRRKQPKKQQQAFEITFINDHKNPLLSLFGSVSQDTTKITRRHIQHPHSSQQQNSAFDTIYQRNSTESLTKNRQRRTTIFHEDSRERRRHLQSPSPKADRNTNSIPRDQSIKFSSVKKLYRTLEQVDGTYAQPIQSKKGSLKKINVESNQYQKAWNNLFHTKNTEYDSRYNTDVDFRGNFQQKRKHPKGKRNRIFSSSQKERGRVNVNQTENQVNFNFEMNKRKELQASNLEIAIKQKPQHFQAVSGKFFPLAQIAEVKDQQFASNAQWQFSLAVDKAETPVNQLEQGKAATTFQSSKIFTNVEYSLPSPEELKKLLSQVNIKSIKKPPYSSTLNNKSNNQKVIRLQHLSENNVFLPKPSLLRNNYHFDDRKFQQHRHNAEHFDYRRYSVHQNRIIVHPPIQIAKPIENFD